MSSTITITIHPSLFDILGEVIEVYRFAGNLSVKPEDVFCFIFEVRGRIKSIRNEQPVVCFGCRHISLRNSHELLLDAPTEFQSALNLLLWIVGFDCGTDDGDVVSLLADTVN